jgi:hypothetical protein
VIFTFFRKSICFICVWLGLEILRLVYKKAFYKNIVGFLSYLTFYPQKKVAPALIRGEQKFLQKGEKINRKTDFSGT